MATTFFPLPPAPAAWPESAILTGHLAPSSLGKYQQAQRAYLAFCATPAQALQATSLALRFAFLRGRGDEPVGLGHQRLVLTDREGTPVKIPEDVRRRLEPFLVGQPAGVEA